MIATGCEISAKWLASISTFFVIGGVWAPDSIKQGKGGANSDSPDQCPAVLEDRFGVDDLYLGLRRAHCERSSHGNIGTPRGSFFPIRITRREAGVGIRCIEQELRE